MLITARTHNSILFLYLFITSIFNLITLRSILLFAACPPLEELEIDDYTNILENIRIDLFVIFPLITISAWKSDTVRSRAKIIFK